MLYTLISKMMIYKIFIGVDDLKGTKKGNG